jgi:hypothetical protein
MRDLRVPTFCKVCIEGLWLSLLKRIKLIDDIRESCQAGSSPNRWRRVLELSLLPLAQFRPDTLPHEESFVIEWKKDGKTLNVFANQTRVEMDDDASLGVYTVEVTFATDEVRMDRESVMVSSGNYIISSRCSGRGHAEVPKR